MRAVVVTLAFGLLVAGCYVGLGGRVGTPPDYPPPATSGDPVAPPQPSLPSDDAGIAPSPGDVSI
jgi:hypothetical protein